MVQLNEHAANYELIECSSLGLSMNHIEPDWTIVMLIEPISFRLLVCL